MNSILRRFRKRNIQTNIHHFVLVILVVAVSISLFAGLLINSWTLKKSVDKYLYETSMPDIWVETNAINLADEDFFAEYFNYDKRLFLQQKVTAESKEYNAKVFVSDGKLSTPYIEKGSTFDGCYIDKNDAEKFGLSINYSVLSLPYEYKGNNVNLEFQINRLCSISEDMVTDETLTVFIDEDLFLSELKSKLDDGIDKTTVAVEYNQVLICTNDVQKSKEMIAGYYESSSSTLVKMYGQEQILSIEKIDEEIKQADFMSFSFPLLFVLISVLVIISAISQLVSSQHYNIGLMKSMGVPTKKIIKNYCGYGMFFCFVGSVVGLIFAPWFIPNLTFDEYDKLYSIPREYVKMHNPFVFNLLIVIGVVLIGFFASYFVCAKLIKKTPIECMRYNVKIKMKSRKKRNIMPNILKMPFRNIKVNKARTIMSIVAVTGCSVLYMIGYAISGYYDANVSVIKISTMKLFSGIFKGFSVVLILLTIVVLIVQIFKERTKEMAMMRLHGVAYFKIWLTVLFEMMFVCLIGLAGAFLLCQPCLYLISLANGVSLNLIAHFMCYFSAFLIVFLMTISVCFLGLPKVYQLSLTDTLKSPE